MLRQLIRSILHVLCILGLSFVATSGRADEVDAKNSESQKLKVNAADAKKQAATAAGQVIVNRAGGRAIPSVRENVDRGDAIERLLVLSPAGPIVVETTLMLDGRPFRVAREEAIDEMMAAASKNGGTWIKALDSPLFNYGNVVTLKGPQRDTYIKNLDSNGDGLVDRLEARRLIARHSQGPAFLLTASNPFSRRTIVNGRYYGQVAGTTDLIPLLDTDGDDQLSEDEIIAASARLKSRDADDNDLLTTNELAVATSNGQSARGRGINVQTRSHQVSHLLGPTFNAAEILKALRFRYQNEEGVIDREGFRMMSDLFDNLDENRNGQIDESEVVRLNQVPSQVKLTVRIGEDLEAGLKIVSATDGLKKRTTINGNQAVMVPGFELKFSANWATSAKPDFSAIGNRYLQQFDKNGNKYLEKEELPASLARQFTSWDADGDGQVYPKEISSSFERRQLPVRTQLRGTAHNEGNSLFQTLDRSGDGRLSLREMRAATDHLQSLDKDQNGELAGKEIPVTISLRFTQGNNNSTGYSRLSAFGAYGSRSTNTQPNNPENAPEWFLRMDRNRDGDVTLKEFLGTKEQFQQFDTNADDLLEPKEAKAATLPK